MSSKTETKRPWRSGFCGIGSPPSMHTHCRMFTATGTACACDCHTPPVVEPQVWDGDYS